MGALFQELWGRLRRWGPWAGQFVLAFSPALVLAWHISQNAVNTPVWDDWERGPLIEKFREGTLTFGDLYAPHIDHRMFFPRLVILACNELSGGDLRWEMWCSFALAVGAALGLARLARGTIGAGRTPWGVVFVANLIVFSPIPWDNWLWGVQVAFLMPMTCTVWALAVARERWRWWVRLLVCSALALVGTHSFGHGFAVWPAVLGLALLVKDFAGTRRERWLFAGTWVVIGTAVVLCYTLVEFRNVSDETHSYMQKPGEPPPSVANRDESLSMPGKLVQFVVILAGNPFARMHLVDPLDLAPVVGWGILGAFALLGLRQLWRRRDASDEEWDRALPWLALGCAALLGMAAVAVGRLNAMGFSRAVSIRYVSISQYLALAVLMLGVLWWQRSRLVAAFARPQWGALVLAVFVGFMVPAWNHGIQMMRLCRQARLQGHAALMFIRHWDPQVPWRIDAKVHFPWKQAKVLDDFGLLTPPLVKSLALKQFKPLDRPRPETQAKVMRFKRLPGGDFSVAGYARIGERPADLVLLTWETEGHEPQIFASAEPTTRMVPQPYPNDLELVGRLRPSKNDHAQWERAVALEDMGFGWKHDARSVLVRAWIFDMERVKAYRIGGSWRITQEGELTSLYDPAPPGGTVPVDSGAPTRH